MPAGFGAALVALQLVTAAPAGAVVTCTLDPSTHTAKADVTPDAISVTIARSGSNNVTVGGVSCGSVTAVDRVDMNLNDGLTFVDFNIANGALGPGFTPESDGSGEIEFVLSNVPTSPFISVTGGAGPDHVTAGMGFVFGIPIGERINLNATADGGTPDADVGIPSLTGSIELRGNGDHDILSGQGTGGTSAGPLTAPLRVFDGPGADTVIGGNGSDEFQQGTSPDAGDTFAGKAGSDTIVYPATLAMTLTQDGLANDGSSNEHDNLGGDIERIVTGPGGDTIVGGPGAQFIDGGTGENSISGGPGNDILTAGTGGDTFHGGKGRDLVSYATRATSIDVTFDGTANDGAQSEGDNVLADVEGAVGSHAGDQLTGGTKTNWLYGNEGDDVVVGGGGNDHLFGSGPMALVGLPNQDGSDVFFGGPGKDTVDESNHAGDLDLSLDGAKNDQVTGHPEQGVDNIHPDVEDVIGGGGDDEIVGSNAANRLVGGAGKDQLSGSGAAD
ncbi:MAG TPA: hypothetical protein VNN79_22695, partial [Actinomycetota bacterium]|nr:hypothetical protein [Actinomycetota bacterium]